MAKPKFVNFAPRPKPRKRPGRHTKNLNKSKKRSYKIQPTGEKKIINRLTPIPKYPSLCV